MRQMLLLIVGFMLAGAGRVAADVTSFSANVSSSLVVLQGGSELQRDDQSMAYPNSAGTIPVEVGRQLQSLNPDGSLNYRASSQVLANDPQYNTAIPRDFVIETALGSTAGNLTLKANTQASQTRRISLLTSEFPGRSVGDAVNLQSTFTLDGAMAAIIPDTAGTAEGLLAACNLNINKDGQSLWNGSVHLTGHADGSVTADASGDFQSSDFVLAENTVPGMGKIWILVFNDAALPFDYSGTVGDSFDLTARLNFDYTVPGGLGAGSAFGTVPAEMSLLTQELFQTSSVATAKVAAPAPEPASLALLLLGAAALSGRRRKNGR